MFILLVKRTVVDGRLSRFKKILSVRVNGPKNSKLRADDLDTIKITFFYRFWFLLFIDWLLFKFLVWNFFNDFDVTCICIKFYVDFEVFFPDCFEMNNFRICFPADCKVYFCCDHSLSLNPWSIKSFYAIFSANVFNVFPQHCLIPTDSKYPNKLSDIFWSIFCFNIYHTSYWLIRNRKFIRRMNMTTP